MFGSEILDVAVGLAFVYLLLSLVCSAVREILEAWFKTRAAFLEKGIRELLRDADGTALAKHLYEHPMVAALYNGSYEDARPKHFLSRLLWRTKLPAYIPSGSFAVALLDMAVRHPAPDAATLTGAEATRISIENVRARIGNIAEPHVRRAILAAVDMAKGDIAQAQRNLQAWFDGSMDRVSGWYKRRTQAWLFLLGFVIAVWLNVDTIAIARHLYRSEAARSALVARAGAAAADTGVRRASLDTLLARVAELDLPIGWERAERDTSAARPSPAGPLARFGHALTSSRPVTLLGWLMTALAVSLGGPFWFDLLNKLMVVRSTVKPREKSREEGSEDRQPRAPAELRVVAGPPAERPNE